MDESASSREFENVPLLEFRQVSKEFGGVRALDRVSFAVSSAGSTGTLVGGTNGAGKSTIINLASGLYRPSAGTIWFQGQNITKRSLEEIARLGIVRTFQNSRIFGSFTVRENVRIGCDVDGRSGRSEADNQTDHLLAEFGLLAVADRSARELSYGQKRLLEIARAMGTSPRLMLLDEPAAGLAPEEYAELIAALRNVRQRGVSVLLVEHVQELFSAFAEHALILDHGSVVFDGAIEAMWHEPAVRQVYLSRTLLSGENGHGEGVASCIPGSR